VNIAGKVFNIIKRYHNLKMEIDDNFEILKEFVGEAIILKTCLLSLFKFLLNLYEDFIANNVFDDGRLQEILIYYSKLIIDPINEIKNFEEEFEDFLSLNPSIVEFLNTNKIDFSIVKTPLLFQNKFFDALIREKLLDFEDIEDLSKEIRKLEYERSDILKLRFNIQERVKASTKCNICLVKGKIRIANHTCKRCKKSVCLKHLFAGGMCKYCSKKYIEEG